MFKQFYIFFHSILILLSLVFSSCGQERSKSKTSFTLGFSVDFVAPAGGMILYGHNFEDTQSITIPVKPGEQIGEVPLVQGRWEFFLISWDGSGVGAPAGPFTGDSKCAFTTDVEIIGGVAEVVLNRTDCKNKNTISTFDGDQYLMPDNSYYEVSSTNFKALKLRACKIVNAAGTCTDAANSSSSSYKILVKGKGFGQGRIIESECRDINLGESYSNNLRLPVGKNNHSFLAYELLLYSYTTDCGQGSTFEDPRKIYRFENGFFKNEQEEFDASFGSHVSVAGANINLTVQHFDGAVAFQNQLFDNPLVTNPTFFLGLTDQTVYLEGYNFKSASGNFMIEASRDNCLNTNSSVIQSINMITPGLFKLVVRAGNFPAPTNGNMNICDSSLNPLLTNAVNFFP